jgi:PAS domain S-box-containing protein
MTLTFSPFVIPPLVAALVAAFLAYYAWQRRPLAGSVSFLVLMIAVAQLSLAYAFMLSAAGASDKLLWAKVQYFGAVTVSVAWLAFTLEYGGRERWLTGRNLALLAIVPAFTLVLVWTNGFHQLIWREAALYKSDNYSTLVFAYGPWFWLHIAYAYILYFASVFLLIQTLRRSLAQRSWASSITRWQIAILLVAVLAPWLGSLLFVFKASPVPSLNPAPFALAITGLVIAFGVLRFRLVDLIPVAHRAVVDSIGDGVLVLDTHGRIVEVNAAGRRIIGRTQSETLGRPIGSVMAEANGDDPFEPYHDILEARAEIALGQGDGQRDFELRISPMKDGRGRLRGRVLLLHDITERKQSESALRAQEELFQNLLTVAQATAERPTLEATLQNTLDVAVSLTRSERGTLFLLDDDGKVSRGIWSLEETTLAEQREVVDLVMESGLAHWVVTQRRPMMIPDTRQDERWFDVPGDIMPVRSALAVPILHREAILGLLTLNHSEVNHYSQEDLNLMRAAAEQMGLALQNAQIYEQQRRLAQQQMILYEVLRAVGGYLEPETVAQVAVEAVTRLTGWKAVALLVPDDDQQALIARGAGGLLALAQGQSIPMKDSISGRAFISGQTQLVGDVSRDPDYFIGHSDIRSEVAVPLRIRQRTLGVLDLESDQLDAFQDEDVRLVESLAEAIALALDNARLFCVVEDERSRLKALIESSRDGVILIGMDRRVLIMNAPAQAYLGLPGAPEEWVNCSVNEILTVLGSYAPEAVEAVAAEGRRMARIDVPPGEGELEIPPRIIHWFNLPVMAGDATLGRLLALRDVTEERLLDQAREDLTHTLVHDLRNPLSNILSAQDLLPAMGSLTGDQETVLHVARDNTERMLGLVNAIMDINQLENGHVSVDRRPVDLEERIAATLHAQLPLTRQKEIQLRYEVPPDLPLAWGDTGLLERVLQNLVDNAIKFTPAGGEVLVKAGLENLGQVGDVAWSRLVVSVRDTGPGISPELQERLFQKFTTGKQAGSGSGLGLAFCKGAIEAHGGRIWVESTLGQGATFSFTLPQATRA